jgi:hypothetical protein
LRGVPAPPLPLIGAAASLGSRLAASEELRLPGVCGDPALGGAKKELTVLYAAEPAAPRAENTSTLGDRAPLSADGPGGAAIVNVAE